MTNYISLLGLAGSEIDDIALEMLIRELYQDENLCTTYKEIKKYSDYEDPCALYEEIEKHLKLIIQTLDESEWAKNKLNIKIGYLLYSTSRIEELTDEITSQIEKERVEYEIHTQEIRDRNSDEKIDESLQNQAKTRIEELLIESTLLNQYKALIIQQIAEAEREEGGKDDYNLGGMISQGKEEITAHVTNKLNIQYENFCIALDESLYEQIEAIIKKSLTESTPMDQSSVAAQQTEKVEIKDDIKNKLITKEYLKIIDNLEIEIENRILKAEELRTFLRIPSDYEQNIEAETVQQVTQLRIQYYENIRKLEARADDLNIRKRELEQEIQKFREELAFADNDIGILAEAQAHLEKKLDNFFRSQREEKISENFLASSPLDSPSHISADKKYQEDKTEISCQDNKQKSTPDYYDELSEKDINFKLRSPDRNYQTAAELIRNSDVSTAPSSLTNIQDIEHLPESFFNNLPNPRKVSFSTSEIEDDEQFDDVLDEDNKNLLLGSNDQQKNTSETIYYNLREELKDLVREIEESGDEAQSSRLSESYESDEESDISGQITKEKEIEQIDTLGVLSAEISELIVDDSNLSTDDAETVEIHNSEEPTAQEQSNITSNKSLKILANYFTLRNSNEDSSHILISNNEDTKELIKDSTKLDNIKNIALNNLLNHDFTFLYDNSSDNITTDDISAYIKKLSLERDTLNIANMGDLSYIHKLTQGDTSSQSLNESSMTSPIYFLFPEVRDKKKFNNSSVIPDIKPCSFARIIAKKIQNLFTSNSNNNMHKAKELRI